MTARLHLVLRQGLHVQSSADRNLLPKARKARALLALLTLSEAQTVSRRRAAGLLWSSLERAAALARLRNALHDLRREWEDAGVDPLVADNENIAFRPDAVLIEIAPPPKAGDPLPYRAGDFLSELDGIDPAFDRWLVRVREERRLSLLAPADDTVPGPHETVPAAAAVGPSVMVVPVDTGSDPGDRAFARSFADIVTATMTRFRWFTTVAPQGGPAGVAGGGGSTAADSADYILFGSLQRSLGELRLSVRLVSQRAQGIVVWTFTWTPLDDLGFAAQERIAGTIAARLDIELLLFEAQQQQRRPPRRRDTAYALVLQATPAIFRLDHDAFIDAGHILEQAVTLDRGSALAHGWLAYWYVFFVGQGWATNRLQAMTEGGRAAEHAMMLDPKDGRAAAIAGHVKAFIGRRLEEARALHEIALQRNPALPLAWHFSGMTHNYAGRLDDALHDISTSLLLAPDNPHGFFAEAALGITHLLRHEHEAAVTVCRRVTQRHPHFTSALKTLIAALGHLGRRPEAAPVLGRLLVLEPGFTLRRFQAANPYQRAQESEHYLTGLRLGGVQ